MSVDQGRHSPITRQRSPWVPQPNLLPPVPGSTADWYSRNVSDGVLWACVADEPGIGWHVSISYRNHRGEPTRYPTWDEQVHALREIGPRVPFAMHLPCDDAGYVALHPSTFHWHQDHSASDRAELDRLRREVERLRRDCKAWMNGVADAVEPLGFDREAACGPADLLPGLAWLVPEPTSEGAGASDPPHAVTTTATWFGMPVVISDAALPEGAIAFVESGAHAPDHESSSPADPLPSTATGQAASAGDGTVWSFRMVNRGQYAITRDGSDVAEILFHQPTPGTASVVPLIAERLAAANHGRFLDPRQTPRSER